MWFSCSSWWNLSNDVPVFDFWNFFCISSAWLAGEDGCFSRAPPSVNCLGFILSGATHAPCCPNHWLSRSLTAPCGSWLMIGRHLLNGTQRLNTLWTLVSSIRFPTSAHLWFIFPALIWPLLPLFESWLCMFVEFILKRLMLTYMTSVRNLGMTISELIFFMRFF